MEPATGTEHPKETADRPGSSTQADTLLGSWFPRSLNVPSAALDQARKVAGLGMLFGSLLGGVNALRQDQQDRLHLTKDGKMIRTQLQKREALVRMSSRSLFSGTKFAAFGGGFILLQSLASRLRGAQKVAPMDAAFAGLVLGLGFTVHAGPAVMLASSFTGAGLAFAGALGIQSLEILENNLTSHAQVIPSDSDISSQNASQGDEKVANVDAIINHLKSELEAWPESDSVEDASPRSDDLPNKSPHAPDPPPPQHRIWKASRDGTLVQINEDAGITATQGK